MPVRLKRAIPGLRFLLLPALAIGCRSALDAPCTLALPAADGDIGDWTGPPLRELAGGRLRVGAAHDGEALALLLLSDDRDGLRAALGGRVTLWIGDGDDRRGLRAVVDAPLGDVPSDRFRSGDGDDPRPPRGDGSGLGLSGSTDRSPVSGRPGPSLAATTWGWVVPAEIGERTRRLPLEGLSGPTVAAGRDGSAWFLEIVVPLEALGAGTRGERLDLELAATDRSADARSPDRPRGEGRGSGGGGRGGPRGGMGDDEFGGGMDGGMGGGRGGGMPGGGGRGRSGGPPGGGRGPDSAAGCAPSASLKCLPLSLRVTLEPAER